MRVDFLYMLAEATILTSASILVVGLLRGPLRGIAGPQIAYWLWSLVPITAIAAALPVPSLSLQGHQILTTDRAVFKDGEIRMDSAVLFNLPSTVPSVYSIPAVYEPNR